MPTPPDLSPVTNYRFFTELTHLPFVERVMLFGSRARGDADTYSDIDLAVDCPDATDEEWERICRLLDTAPVLDTIDYVRYDQLEDGLFRSRIDRDRKVLYARN